MTQVAVVADAGPRAGLGHLARCSAVAAALAARGTAVRAYALGAPEPVTLDGVAWTPVASARAAAAGDAVVLDSYSATAADLDTGAPVAVFSDGRPPGAARLLIATADDGAVGAAGLVGLAYAPLRRAFWGLPPARPREHVERVLVATGGGDVGAAAHALVDAAHSGAPGAVVALVRGPLATGDPPDGVELVTGATSLAAELLRADLVVCSAGQTALEAAAAGAPSVVVALVDNQRRNATALDGAGAAVVVPVEDAAGAAGRLAAAREERAALSARAQRAVDGYGAFRIAYAVERLARGEATLPGA